MIANHTLWLVRHFFLSTSLNRQDSTVFEKNNITNNHASNYHESNGSERLYFVTWNVATHKPSQEPWELLGMGKNGSGNSPDFIVVGLQEVRARPRDVLRGIFFDDPWTEWLNEALSDKDYVHIKTKKMQNLVLNVFCRMKHMVHLREIEAHSTKIGFGGNWGNKGAVSVRFNIYGVSICVLNTHLTAHYENLDDRISDYRRILDKHRFDVPDTPKTLNHDYSFWLGDLNFRLSDENLSPKDISALVTNKNLDFLLTKDQLKLVMKNGEAFSEFTEGKIRFSPTYKFESPSRKYDLRRRPSWTDRILYRVAENADLKADEYNYTSHPYYTLSDHIPVTAEFAIKTRLDYELHRRAEFEPICKWSVGEENSATVKLFGGVRASSDKSDFWPELKMEVREVISNDDALKEPGTYRLVYVAKNEDGIKSVFGVSSPFPGISGNN